MVNGLAWTEAGGEILEVEVNVMEGSGKLELTGNLGDVMKESAQAALSAACGAGRKPWGSIRTSIRPRTSTSTSRRARCPRTAPPPVLPWLQPCCRP